MRNFPLGIHAGEVLNQITVVKTVSGNGSLIVPAEVQAGDAILFCELSQFVDGIPPDGFSELFKYDVLSFPGMIIFSYMLTNGTEGGSTVTPDHPSNSDAYMLLIRGNTRIKAVSPEGFATRDTPNNPDPLVLANSGGLVPQIVLAMYSEETPFSPRTFTPQEDAEMGPHGLTYLKYKVYNSSPQNTTIDMDDEGDENVLVGGWLEFS